MQLWRERRRRKKGINRIYCLCRVKGNERWDLGNNSLPFPLHMGHMGRKERADTLPVSLGRIQRGHMQELVVSLTFLRSGHVWSTFALTGKRTCTGVVIPHEQAAVHFVSPLLYIIFHFHILHVFLAHEVNYLKSPTKERHRTRIKHFFLNADLCKGG